MNSHTDLSSVPKVELRETGGDIAAIASSLGEQFATRAAASDEGDRFVSENYQALKQSGLVEAGVPRELGGGGADIDELAAMLRTLAYHCGSTGLAFSMHTHQVAIPAWRWRHQKATAVEPLLKRIANDRIILLSSGGSDWIGGSGKAEKVEGGYRISARKVFTSAAAAGDVLMTGAVVHSDSEPDAVIHFPVPMKAPEVKVLDTWHTLGLRGTGSHDAVADEVFVPAARTFSLFDGPVLDRPLYRFPAFGFFALSIAAAALGNARGAIDELVALATHKVGLGSSRTLAERTGTHATVAEAEASLRAARAVYYEAIDAAWQSAQDDQVVSVDLRNGLRLAATHATRSAADVVRSMYDLGGGTAIYDDAPLQRRFRDAHTATAHFQVNEASRELPGRLLLGQPADTPTL